MIIHNFHSGDFSGSAKNLAIAYSKNPDLRRVEISQQELDNFQIASVCFFIIISTCLDTFRIVECDRFRREHIRCISQALGHNLSLRKLEFVHCHMDDERVLILSSALQSYGKLQKLRIGGGSVGPKGVVSILQILKTNPITKLHLEENEIRTGGAKSLSHALKTNTRVQDLSLSTNNIGAEGMRSISDMLKINTTLQKLNVATNHFGNEELDYLSNVLTTNTSLHSLNIGEIDVDSKGIEQLCEVLKMNTVLKELKLPFNYHIDAVGAKSMCEALTFNTTLVQLDLTSTMAAETDYQLFSEVLEMNISLQDLDLIDLYMDHEGNKEAKEVDKKIQRLLKINAKPKNFREQFDAKKKKRICCIGLSWSPISSIHAQFPSSFQQDALDLMKVLQRTKSDQRPTKRRKKTELHVLSELPWEIWIHYIIPWIAMMHCYE